MGIRIEGREATSFYTGSMVTSGTTCYPDEALQATAWYCANSAKETRPVGTRTANPWGLHDMLGNSWEWVLDALRTYPEGPLVDFFAETWIYDTPEIKLRSFRGGGVQSIPAYFPAPHRLDAPANTRAATIGFRLARTIQKN
jgi:formylglycine-generating enzyme required for sulfatase activity